jgi:hypothetical protein
MKSCSECRQVMMWVENGEQFIDCRIGKMPEDIYNDAAAAKNCKSYSPWNSLEGKSDE